MPVRRTPLRGPIHAQFWFELRRNGFLLPAATLLVMVIILIPPMIGAARDAHLTMMSLGWMLATPLVLAGAMAASFAKPDVWTSGLTLPTFISTRPMSNADLLLAKLMAGAVSAAATWGIVLASVTFVALCGDPTPVMTIWNAVDVEMRWILTALVLLCMMLMTWKLLVGMIWSASSGDALLYFSVITLTVGSVGIAMVVLFNREVMRWVGGILGPWIGVIGLLLCAMYLAKLVIPVFLWRRNIQGSLVTDGQVAAYVGAWAIASLVIATTVFLILQQQPSLEENAPGAKYLAAMMVMLALPSARIAWTPQLIALNRHR